MTPAGDPISGTEDAPVTYSDDVLFPVNDGPISQPRRPQVLTEAGAPWTKNRPIGTRCRTVAASTVELRQPRSKTFQCSVERDGIDHRGKAAAGVTSIL